MKPPVEAPTSAQSRPSTSTSNASSAACELLAAARDEARRAVDLELGVLVELLARLVVPRHESGENQRLRLRARLRKPALDEEDVEALFFVMPAPRKAFCADQGLSATNVATILERWEAGDAARCRQAVSSTRTNDDAGTGSCPLRSAARDDAVLVCKARWPVPGRAGAAS